MVQSGMKYVLGLAFNKDKTLGAFLRKERPEWQKGCLNGFGGKVEPGESFIDAMVREFQEESGVATRPEQWSHLGHIHGNSPEGSQFAFDVFVLADDCFEQIQQNEDEKIVWSRLDLNFLRDEGVSNLAWLVSLALDQDSARIKLDVTYLQNA